MARAKLATDRLLECVCVFMCVYVCVFMYVFVCIFFFGDALLLHGFASRRSVLQGMPS